MQTDRARGKIGMQAERQTDRPSGQDYTDRQSGRKTDRQTKRARLHRQTDRQAGRQRKKLGREWIAHCLQ